MQSSAKALNVEPASARKSRTDLKSPYGLLPQVIKVCFREKISPRLLIGDDAIFPDERIHCAFVAALSLRDKFACLYFALFEVLRDEFDHSLSPLKVREDFQSDTARAMGC